MATPTATPQNETLQALRALIAANVPVKLESLPGAGKTSFLNDLFQASNGFLHTMVAVTHDPTDFGGIPVPDMEAGKYRLLPGEWATDLADAVASKLLVGLFLDEINTAGRSVLAACLKVVDERRVGYFALPPSVRILLAMNPAEANGGVDLTPAMANRVAHLPFDFPVDEWAKGLASGSFPTPDPLTLPDEDSIKTAARIHAQGVAAFLSADRSFVDAYPDDVLLRSKAYPTRRSWTMAVRAMGAADLLGHENVRETVLDSLVGRRAADAYADWQERMSIDLNPIFDDPKGAPLPNTDDGLFAALLKLGEETRKRNDQTAVDSACIVLARVFEDRPGIAAASIQSLAQWLMDNPSFSQSVTVRESLRTFAPVLKGGGGS